MSRSPRLLLVVPANNTSMEPEIRALCLGVADVQVARVSRPPRMLTVEDLPAYGETTLESVTPYLSPRPDLVVYGCTAAGFLSHFATGLPWAHLDIASTAWTYSERADSSRGPNAFGVRLLTNWLEARAHSTPRR